MKKLLKTGKLMRLIVAVAVVIALLMSVSVIVLAVNGGVNENKKVVLDLNAQGSNAFPCIRQSDVVTVTASVSDLTSFDDGIYGFTIDVIYDSAVFSYVDESARASADSLDFNVFANPNNDNTLGEDVVTVLFFADDLSYIDNDAVLFSLDFEVTGNVTDDFDFEPFDWKFADIKNGGGFELITLDPEPDAETVSLKKIKAGDIDGDGNVAVNDIVFAKKHIVEAIELTGGALLAGNCDNTDGLDNINALDIIWMKREILGLN